MARRGRDSNQNFDYKVPRDVEGALSRVLKVMEGAKSGYLRYFKKGGQFRFSAIFPSTEAAKQARLELTAAGIKFPPREDWPEDLTIVAGSLYGVSNTLIARAKTAKYAISITPN